VRIPRDSATSLLKVILGVQPSLLKGDNATLHHFADDLPGTGILAALLLNVKN